jgi:fatty acid desaturase
MKRGEYARAIRPLLPKAAFAPSPWKMWVVCIHLLLFACSTAAFRVTPSLYWPVLSLISGHSLACIAFLAHEVSHDTIIRSRLFLYPAELVLWGLKVIPPTLWRRVHNETHHVHTNTVRDPDRKFLRSEQCQSIFLYSVILYPNRVVRYNVLVFGQFVIYVARQIVAVFYPQGFKPRINPFKPDYATRTRLRICAELVLIIVLQGLVYLAAGSSLLAYAFAAPAALLVTSAIVMGYVFTNHFLNVIDEGDDPLRSTTSVAVPSLFNKLHANFSYHTEHHLFPRMNSDFYPVVSEMLQSRFPDAYNKMDIGEAWRLLWASDLFASPVPPGVQGGSRPYERRSKV